MRFTCLLLLSVLAHTFAPGLARSASYVVYPDGSGDFPTIAAAIGACNAGDEILLGDGVFTGPGNRDLTIDEDITLRSLSGDPRQCVIDCEGTDIDPHRAMTLHVSPAARIAGITCMRANQSALWLGLDTSPTIEDCIFCYNEGSQGGAIYIDVYANPLIQRCTFHHNTAVGGGAFCI